MTTTLIELKAPAPPIDSDSLVPALAPGMFPPSPAPASGGRLRRGMVRLLGGMTWLKPPYRTMRHLAINAYSLWNIHRTRTDAQRTIRRVNVGCGADVRDGWWNIDFTHFPGVDEIRDATLPWRHRDLDVVFCEHFLEHLTLFQGIDFLTHAGNALREGGILRLSTPNVTAVMHDCYALHPETLDRRLHDTIGLNSCFHGYGHQFLYSAEFLSWLLHELGFAKVRQRHFGESERPDLRGLGKHGPYKVKDGVPSLLIFEAVKGSRRIGCSAGLQSMLQEHYYDDQQYR